MNEFDQLVKQHLALQGQVAKDPQEIKLAEVETLLANTRAAGRHVAEVEQREHLRKILRYWGAFVYEQTGEYPATHLTPFSRTADDGAAVMPPAASVPSYEESAIPKDAPFDGATQPQNQSQPQAQPTPSSARRPQSSWLSNPLLWLLLLALAIIALVILAVLFFIPVTSTESPGPITTTEANTGIPPDILGPTGEEGAIPVTRPPATTNGGVDFVLTVRSEATLQELATSLQTNVETLQVLNPSLANPPWNGTILALIGQPDEDARLVVTSGSASVYDQPAWRAQVIGTLPNGAIAPVIGRTADYGWYWINTADGPGWLAEADIGLIYPTVPDSLPIIARIQLVPDDSVDGNDNGS